MPSDANGVHSLPNGYLAEDGDTIQPSQHNPPLEDLSAGLTERLMRSGVAPMTGPLKLADGVSSAPGLAFNSDPSAGFYLSNGKIYSTKPIVQKELIGLGPLPWTRYTAPANWVFCSGQTLSRVTYPDLWAVAQIEIAGGSQLYNNGNGSSTFGIMDMIGRVPVGVDPVPQRIIGYTIPGLGGGVGSVALDASQIAPHRHDNTLNDNGHAHGPASGGNFVVFTAGGGPNTLDPGVGVTASAINAATTVNGTGITINNAFSGGGAPHTNMQPSLAVQYILYAGA
jgi:microcystin-dependent protein